MMGNQKVVGAVPFSSRDERRNIYKELKAEYGDQIEITNENGMLVYTFIDLAS